LLNHRDVANAENAWSNFLPTSCIHAVVLTPLTYIIHRDVVAAIAPCNLAAFPPSLEVNADIA